MNLLDMDAGGMPDDPSNCLPFPKPYSGNDLSLRHARQLVNAEAFAASQGWPLTAHVTIHLRMAEGFTEAAWSAFQVRLLDKAACWLRHRDIPVAFAWVRENGPVKGPHLHLMLHLPHTHWRAFKLYLLKVGRFEVADASGDAGSDGDLSTITWPHRPRSLGLTGHDHLASLI